MTRRRVTMLVMSVAASVGGVAPLAAQSTERAPPPATAAPTPTPTPTPAPTGNVVGPPQLRDFNLNGTVTPAPIIAPAPSATPSPRAAEPATGVPAAPRATSPAPRGAPTTPLPAPTPAPTRQPTIAAPDSDPSPAAVTVDLPAASATAVLPGPAFAPAPPPVAAAPGAVAAAGIGWWPWLAAALALALGAVFLLWRRGQRAGGPRYATDQADLGALIEPQPAGPALPHHQPAPQPAPAPKPKPPRAPTPQVDTRPSFPPPRAATRAPAPPPAAPPPLPPSPTPAPLPPPIGGGIVASGLKPRIEFELVPIRAETDADGNAAVTFDVIVHNRGSAPARDVLVEAQLINAGPRVDEDVGRFFMQPAGTGERVPNIPPMGRVSIRSRLAIAGATFAPLVVEGRSLFVPLVAINAFYRWSGGELANSSSFLVGRGEGEEGKLAPFRLDRGARSWSGLAARLHSTGLQQA